ncbi:MAG: hypothetical protein GY790_07140 [Bacteroidetes bacterium]|nr:hypothetical protein [Bacteroidota bacterium]
MEAKGVEPSVCNVPVPVFPVFPGELVTYFSDEEEKALFQRTINRLESNGNNDAMILCTARARLSMADTYEYVVNSFRQRQRPSGILTLNVLAAGLIPMGITLNSLQLQRWSQNCFCNRWRILSGYSLPGRHQKMPGLWT